MKDNDSSENIETIPKENQDQHKSKSIKSNIGKALIRSGLDAVSKVIDLVRKELE